MHSEKGSQEKMERVRKMERITIDDLAPTMPEREGTVIIVQRNVKDNRDPGLNIEIGALMPDAAAHARRHAQECFDRMFRALPSEERDTIDILVVAGDTKLDTPILGIKSNHKRAVETGEQVMAGIQASMITFGLQKNQLLNRTGKPVELSSGKLRDLRMFEDSPAFVRFLKEKYGTGREFWAAYENDTERETREQMGAEGPDDIAQRVQRYLTVVMNAMASYHRAHPGRRIIVWAVSHYDTISPYVKKCVAGIEMTNYLPVDHGAGIAIHVTKDQTATTTIQGATYTISPHAS